MGFSLRRWRPIHLLGSWVAYWIVLAAVTLSPAIGAIRRLASAPRNTGQVSFGVGDGQFELTVIEAGKTIFDGRASLLATTLLVAGPPLLSWLLWMWTRPKRGERAPAGPGALGEGAWPGVPQDADRTRSHERRPEQES